MVKIDWRRKLTSRKLWVAVASFITGVMLIFNAGATVETISGAVMAFGSVVAYIVGEGLTDAAQNKNKNQGDTETNEDLPIS
jgi:drug/metabolite transporter (DMT)-like permease